MKESLQAPVQEPIKLTPTPTLGLSLQRKCACGGHTTGDGECDDCRRKRVALKPRSSGGGGFFVGSFGGHDFSRIRVSNGSPPRIQTKLDVGEPGDAWEQEADQAAGQVMRMQASADAGGSSSPAQLAQRDSNHETPAEAAAPAPEAATPASPEATPEAAAPEAAETPTAEEAPAAGLIVEDDAAELGPGQARKSEFMAELRTSICATADAVLASVGQSTRGCPYIEYWIGYYSTRSSQYIERAIRKYAPETAGATAARDYIPLISERVRQGVVRWATTGEVAVPEGVPTGVPAEAGAEGAETSGEETRSVAFKRRNGSRAVASDPRAIQAELGHGQPLEGALKQRMESAFGHDFSSVRVHADTTAISLSDRLNARAFTVGEHVAFASGEYRPGTLVGDALIAHELAHVVQQGGAGVSRASPQEKQADYTLEEDADLSAVGAVVGLWGRAKAALANIARNAMPRLKSGLKLQRCPAAPAAALAGGGAIELGGVAATALGGAVLVGSAAVIGAVMAEELARRGRVEKKPTPKPSPKPPPEPVPLEPAPRRRRGECASEPCSVPLPILWPTNLPLPPEHRTLKRTSRGEREWEGIDRGAEQRGMQQEIADNRRRGIPPPSPCFPDDAEPNAPYDAHHAQPLYLGGEDQRYNLCALRADRHQNGHPQLDNQSSQLVHPVWMACKICDGFLSKHPTGQVYEIEGPK